jgi:hypothetical protein
MGILANEEPQKLIDLLLKLPNIDAVAIRRSLLAGLPDNLRNSISTADAPRLHVINIIDVADGEAWGQLTDDTWSIIHIIDNSLSLVRGSRLEKELQTLLNTLKARALERANALAQPAPSPPVLSTRASRLTGQQYEKFQEALLSAFTDRGDLEMMLLFKLNTRLETIVGDGSLRDTVFKLIEWAQAHDMIDQLVNAARSANPGNPALREFAEEFGFAPASPSPKIVEKVVAESNSFLDVDAWRVGLIEVEPTVCRIEVPHYGTGFLVGPSTVMTVFHVIAGLLKETTGSVAQAATLRFGYKTSADGKTMIQGQEYKLADDWLIDSSPTEQLDYALLRVEGAPGDDPVGGQAGAPPRRWLRPATEHVFRRGDPLFMMQHPYAGPLKLSLSTDAIIGVNADKTRVRYGINAEPGSSGSPCFNENWQLIAMHHGSFKDETTNNMYEEGIPMAAIAAQAKGMLGT